MRREKQGSVTCMQDGVMGAWYMSVCVIEYGCASAERRREAVDALTGRRGL